MDAELARALAPLQHDLATAGVPAPDVREESWADDSDMASAMLYSADGSGAGVSVTRGTDPVEQVVELAGQVQDWAVEVLWNLGRPATWPECPDHRNAHPLAAALRDGRAAWLCPKNHRQVVLIGHLVPLAG